MEDKTPKQRRLKRRQEINALNAAAGRKREKLKSRKWYVRELDKEFSRQVRAKYPKCFNCLKPVEHCFHYLTRKNYSTRWDFDNAIASCASCNYRYEHEADFISDIIECYKISNGVDKWEALVLRHHTPTKFSRHDLAAMLDKMRGLKIASEGP